MSKFVTDIQIIDDADPSDLIPVLWSGWTPTALGWDVGANVGQSLRYLLPFCQKVVCFEPARESYAVLIHKIFDQGLPVLASPLALSDTSGTVNLVADPAKLATGQLGDATSWEGLHGPVRTVECATADDLIALGWDAPGFIKIDVEGHEDKVLLGARRLLRTHHPEVLVEVHSRPLGGFAVQLLDKLGYQRVTTHRHPAYAEGSHDFQSHYYLKARP